MSDKSLVEIFQTTGNHDHFSEIFRRYKRSVFAGCLAMLRNRTVAEELTQETFLRLFTRIESFQGGSFPAWIHRVAQNLCLNHLAATRQDREPLREEGPLFEESGKSLEAEFLLADEVRATLDELPAHQRTAMKLFYLDGYSYKEISECLGLPQEQVKSHLQNGKRQFRIRWEALHSAKGHPDEP